MTYLPPTIHITMKEVIVHPLPSLTTELHDIPIPTPADNELIVKVVVAGSNVKGKYYAVLCEYILRRMSVLIKTGPTLLHKKYL